MTNNSQNVKNGRNGQRGEKDKMYLIAEITMTEIFSQIGGIPPILFGWLFAGLAVLTFAIKYAFYQRRKQGAALSDKS